MLYNVYLGHKRWLLYDPRYQPKTVGNQTGFDGILDDMTMHHFVLSEKFGTVEPADYTKLYRYYLLVSLILSEYVLSMMMIITIMMMINILI